LIEKKPKMLCRTSVGKLTGLEPMTVLSQWYPCPNLYKGRPVEGSYLFEYVNGEMPSIDDSCYEMKPKQLVEGCKEVLTNLRDRLRSHYTISSPHRESWERCFCKHIPDNEDADDDETEENT
jgi:hypothetical protein